MFCTNCGATIPENSAFCTNCGAKVGGAAQAPVEQPMQPQAPVYEQPVQPQAPVYEQPVQPQAPVYEQPVQPQAPVYEQPVQPQAPVYQQPVQQAPVYQQPVQQAPYGQPMYQQPTYVKAKQPMKKGVIAAVIGIIAAIIVVVVLLIVFVFGGSKNKNMEDPIDKVMKAVNEQKLSYLYESMPSFMAKDIKEEINDEYENEKEFWAEEFGIGEMYSSMTMSYEIADKEKLDKDEIDELEEEIEYEFDKKVSISSAYVLEVDVEATLKFNTKALKEEYGNDYAELLEYYYGEDWKKGIEESDTLEAVVIKINDEWFLYDPEAFF